MYRGLSLSGSALLAALLLLAGTASRAPGQAEGAVVVVTVRAADSARPLPGAQVLVRGVGMRGTTDASGVARLTGLSPGAREVEVRFLGYAPARSIFHVPATGPVGLDFELTPRPVRLAGLRVAARSSVLENSGFYRRRRGGHGTFITRQEIERIQPHHLSDVLRRVSGIQLTPLAGGLARPFMRGMQATGCPIQYFVDGVQTLFFDIDEVRPGDVEGLEIYRGASTVPPSFNRGTALCGVIVIWTRVE